jgi:hypothetical protein
VYSGFSTGSGIQRYLIEAPAVHTGGSDSLPAVPIAVVTPSTDTLQVRASDSTLIGVIAADSSALRLVTLNDKAISLVTSLTERVRVLGSGNVGIGTNTPAEKLTVAGNVKATSIVDTPATRAGGSTIPFLQSTTTGLNSSQNVLWQHTTNEATPTDMQLLIETKGVNSTNPAVERLQIGAYRNGYRNMHLQPSGRVMIGGDYSTTAVSSTLDVGGTLTVRGNIMPESTNTRDIGTSGLTFNGVYCNGLIQPSTSNAMSFNCNSAERMRITSSGNVGIGNTTPSSLLDISSAANPILSIGATNYTNLPAADTDVSTIRMHNHKGSGDKYVDIKAVVRGGSAYYMPSIVFATKPDWPTASINRMIISESGLVGINTTTPATLLDVNGHSTFRGNVLPGAANFTLGSSTARWAELFCTNGTINQSDLNDKTAIVPLAPADSLTTLLKLHPVSYKWKENSHDRYHTGFISQQVEEDVGVDVAHDWGFFIKSPGLAEDVLDEEGKVVDVIQHPDTYGLRYTELISPLVGAVQCLAQRVESLESAGENKRKQYEVVLEEQRTAMVQYQQEITSLNDRLAVIENALKTMEFIN